MEILKLKNIMNEIFLKKELRVSTAEQRKQKKETVKYNTGIILNYLVRGEQRKRMKKR